MSTPASPMPRPPLRLRHRAALVATAAAIWLALAAPTRAAGLPDELGFDAPAGWTDDADMGARLRRIPGVRETWGYASDDGEALGVMQIVFATPDAGAARAQVDAYLRGVVNGAGKQATVDDVAYAETTTTGEVAFAAVAGAVVLRQRCVSWVARDRQLHAACGMCVGRGAIGRACQDALASIRITAPDAARLPLASADAAPSRSAAYEAGRLVGLASVPIGAIVLALYFIFRRR